MKPTDIAYAMNASGRLPSGFSAHPNIDGVTLAADEAIFGTRSVARVFGGQEIPTYIDEGHTSPIWYCSTTYGDYRRPSAACSDLEEAKERAFQACLEAQNLRDVV
nr:hypothetical protein [Zoogloeaceae bacterium]